MLVEFRPPIYNTDEHWSSKKFLYVSISIKKIPNNKSTFIKHIVLYSYFLYQSALAIGANYLISLQLKVPFRCFTILNVTVLLSLFSHSYFLQAHNNDHITTKRSKNYMSFYLNFKNSYIFYICIFFRNI